MISVVICSVNQALAAQIKRNIHKTVGVPWELIVMDNTRLRKGITEVYNLGASSARYDIVCFLHEDVLFETPNWGRIVADAFGQNDKLGLIGLAGSKYKSRSPSGWYTGVKAFDCCNILHQDPQGNSHRIYMNPDDRANLQRTITIDGVFMCCKKSVWQKIRFSEELKGFHLYDIDFSFNVSKSFQCAVTYDISLVHLTQGGDYSNSWLENTLTWHRKFRNQLPAILESNTSQSLSQIELAVQKTWLNRLKIEPITYANKLRWLKSTNALSNLALLPFALVFLFFRIARRLKPVPPKKR